MRFGLIWQTWSSRDLSLGLLETRFYKSWSRSWTSESWSWSWNLRVLVSVLVLEPSSLGLGLGLGTWDSGANEPPVSSDGVSDHSSYAKFRPLGWSGTQWHVQNAASIARKVWCPPATSAPVERIFSHSGLLMRANTARMGDNRLSQLVYLRCNNKL